MSDWGIFDLSDVGSFSKGKGITKSELVTEGIPCIRYGEIYTSHHHTVKQFYSFISRETAQSSRRLKFNDLLFASSGETTEDIGKAVGYRLSDEAYAGGDVIILSVHEAYRADYIAYFLNSVGRYQINKLGSGNSIVHIYSRDLKNVKVTLPPLLEQKAIADLLSTWDTAIEKTEALITAKQQLFDWLVKCLINKSNINAEKLGKIADVSSGGTPKSTVSEYYGGEIPWVSIADMTQKGMWVETTRRMLTKNGLNNSNAQIYPKNTVLYAMYASIGECSIAAVELSSSQAILGIRPNPQKFHFEYLYYYLSSLKQRIKLQGQWGTQSNLNTGIVKNFKIPLPSLLEQKRIAKILNTAKQEIDSLKSLAKQYRTQKRGLMQKLLTGKWRIKV